jgi:ATP-dependent DNA helicase RecQ
MENSFQQARNLDGAFKFTRERKRYAPCLLVDDMVDSRWTFTVVSALLKQNGVEAVHPLALALNSTESD